MAEHHSCTGCGFYAATRHDLEKHHRVERHFACEDCDFVYTAQVELDSHLTGFGHSSALFNMTDSPHFDNDARVKLAISEEASMECFECARTFCDLGALQQHRSHTNAHPRTKLRCPVSRACPVTFTTAGAILTHIVNERCNWNTKEAQCQALRNQISELQSTSANAGKEADAKHAQVLRRLLELQRVKETVDSENGQLTQRNIQLENAVKDWKAKVGQMSNERLARVDEATQARIAASASRGADESKILELKDSIKTYTSKVDDLIQRNLKLADSCTASKARCDQNIQLVAELQAANRVASQELEQMSIEKLHIAKEAAQLKIDLEAATKIASEKDKQLSDEKLHIAKDVVKPKMDHDANELASQKLEQSSIEKIQIEKETAQLNNDIEAANSFAIQKVEQSSIENLHIAKEAARFRTDGSVSTADALSIKGQMRSLQLQHQEVLDRLTRSEKEVEARLTIELNRLRCITSISLNDIKQAKDTTAVTISESPSPTKIIAIGIKSFVQNDFQMTEDHGQLAVERCHEAHKEERVSDHQVRSGNDQKNSHEVEKHFPGETTVATLNTEVSPCASPSPQPRSDRVDFEKDKQLAFDHCHSSVSDPAKVQGSSVATRRYPQTFTYPGTDARTIAILTSVGLYTPRTSPDHGTFLSEWTLSKMPFCRSLERFAAVFVPDRVSWKDSVRRPCAPQRVQDNANASVSASVVEANISWKNRVKRKAVSERTGLPTPQNSPKCVHFGEVDEATEEPVASNHESRGLGIHVDRNDEEIIEELASSFERQLSLDPWGDVSFPEKH